MIFQILTQKGKIFTKNLKYYYPYDEIMSYDPGWNYTILNLNNNFSIAPY